MKKIYLIRHGRQSDKRCNVNVSLSPEGKEQARLLGKRMQNWHIDKLYASKLIRAMETAEILNEYLHIPYEKVEHIHEIDFGELTGRTDENIKLVFERFVRERDKWSSDLAYPGGESGEDVVKRAYPQLLELVKRPEQNIAIITHGGVIRSLLAYVLGMDLKNKLCFTACLENTSVTQLLFDEERERFILEGLNDFSHLEPYVELLRESWKPPKKENGG